MTQLVSGNYFALLAYVEMFEREYIEDLMRRHKMNLSAAAREAQIDRKHLRELIRKYGLDPRGDLAKEEGQ